MTLAEIQTLLVSIDPDIKHYYTDRAGAYTYWEETQRLPLTSDDQHEEAWRFYVHRYTQDPWDQLAQHIFLVLDQDPRITVRHTVAYDADNDYIHHIYDCEGC